MRPVLALSLFASILCTGCALVEDATHNFVNSVTTPIETHKELARNRRWADSAWEQACARSGPRTFSDDYAQGFKDGYVEYLFRGGNGEPPLLAPKRYRHLRYQTPEGYLAVEDWFAGYRNGTAVARDSGARRWITGVTGLPSEPLDVPAHEPTKPKDVGEPLPLPLPKTLPELPPKVNFEQPVPAKEAVEIEPPSFPNIDAEPAPAVEPVQAKFMGVIGAPTVAPEPPDPKARIKEVTVPPQAPEPKARIKGVTVLPQAPEPKATIMGVTVPPQAPEPKATIKGVTVLPPAAPIEPEPTVEPARVRIRMVSPVMPKD